MKEEHKAQLWARFILKNNKVNVFAHTRDRRIVTYRALHVHMLRNVLGWGLEKISRFYKDNGKKSYDHATVLHALKMFDIYCKYDKDLQTTFDLISDQDTDRRFKLQALKSKLDYIDQDYYTHVDECLERWYKQTTKDLEVRLQQERKRKEELKYAL